jgi:hypothetical protein
MLETGKFCYFIDETMYVDDLNLWRPAIVVENEDGYNPVDYTWKGDFKTVQKMVNIINERMGISEERAAEIVRSSMFPQTRKAA